MSSPAEQPAVLELDDEFVDSWSVATTFTTGELPYDRLKAMYLSESASHDGKLLFVMSHDRNEGTTGFVTQAHFEGTQRSALTELAGRYVGILGGLATNERVASSRMNVAAVADALAEAELARCGIGVGDEDGVVAEGWRDIADVPDSHTLDVTSHLKQILREINPG